MTTPQQALFLADRSRDYLRSYSTDVQLAQHAIELGQMDRADRLIKQAQVSLWLATDCIDQANAVMDALEGSSTGAEVIYLPVRPKAQETVLTGLCGALFSIADRYDPLPPCDVSVDQ